MASWPAPASAGTASAGQEAVPIRIAQGVEVCWASTINVVPQGGGQYYQSQGKITCPTAMAWLEVEVCVEQSPDPAKGAWQALKCSPGEALGSSAAYAPGFSGTCVQGMSIRTHIFGAAVDEAGDAGYADASGTVEPCE